MNLTRMLTAAYDKVLDGYGACHANNRSKSQPIPAPMLVERNMCKEGSKC